MTSIQSSSASRRGILKGGAIGLGSVAGAFAMSGVSASAAEAGLTSSGATALAPGAAAPMIAPGAGADYFLWVDDIPGESADADHPRWIDLLSYSWGGAAVATSASGSGRAASRPSLSDLTFMTGLGSASPLLFIATMTGRHIPSAVLEGVTHGAEGVKFLEFEMTDVVITSYQTSASSSIPTDSVAMNFDKITFTYWPQKADGSMGGPISVTWDSTTNSAS